MRPIRLALVLPVVVSAAAIFVGCEDPVPLIPRGAWSLTFESPSSKCLVEYHNAAVGKVEAEGKLELKADGSEEAKVQCSVKASGGGYAVTGEVNYKGQYLAVDIPTLKKDSTFDAPSTGRVEFQTGKTAELYYGDDCIIYFVNDQLVDKGKVWASFQCPTVSAGDSVCEVTQGYFAFELCEGTQTAEDGEEEE